MKTVMVFPGYGSQFVGMGKELYDEQRIVQEYFEEAGNCLGINFVQLCFASSEATLQDVRNAYPALFLLSAASVGLVRATPTEIAMVASVDMVSWYSSLYAAGAISFPDGLYILSKLAQLYAEFLQEKAFKAVVIPDIVHNTLSDICMECIPSDTHAAVIVSVPHATVLAGDIAAVDVVIDELRTRKKLFGRVKEFSVLGGLHMPLVEGVVTQLRDYLEKIDFKDTHIPVVNPLTGKLLKKGQTLRELALTALISSLRIDLTIKTIKNYSVQDSQLQCITALPDHQLHKQLSEWLPEMVVHRISTIIEQTQTT